MNLRLTYSVPIQHKGSQGYLKEERVAVLEWIGSRETIKPEELLEELREKYGVVYQSKQSYYEMRAVMFGLGTAKSKDNGTDGKFQRTANLFWSYNLGRIVK